MKLRFSVMFAIMALSAWAQTSSNTPLPSQALPQQPAPLPGADPSADRFAGMRESADRLRLVFEKLDADNIAEIDALMRTRKCQIKRVDGLLTRVSEALDLWNDAELKYWTAWGAAEADRVEGQQKSLASMEADEKRAEDLLASTQKDRANLLRDKAILEKFPSRTEEIRKRIDSLVNDIKDSEARLTEAQKNYDDITIRVRNMQVSINARLIEIRQSQRRVEAYGLEMKADYEKTRAAANEICNVSAPDTTRAPLPSSKKKASAQSSAVKP